MGLFSKTKRPYFDGAVSPGFVSLYTGKTIVIIASGLLGIFLPIFLYTLFDESFHSVFLYYGAGYLLYAAAVALGAQFLNQYGFRRALRTSVFLGAAFYLIFYFINAGNMAYLIPLSLFVITLYRLAYWLPYHVDFAKFTDPKNRGRQISAVRSTRLMATVIIPVVAGFLVSRFSFDALFVIAIMLYLISGIPYITIPRTREKYSWSYFETWKIFFKNARHKVTIAYFADGAEAVVGLVVWPIFIFELLNGNFFEVGLVSTLIIGVAVALQLAAGKKVDARFQKEKMLRWGSAFYAFGWIVKIFITTAFEIFVAGAYHSITKIFTRTPFDAMTYDMFADEGHYVDEFTVIKEMAFNLGKAAMCLAVILFSFFAAIQWTFVLAAGAALLLNLLKARDLKLHAPVPMLKHV